MRSHVLRRLLSACLLAACLATPSVAVAESADSTGSSAITRILDWIGGLLSQQTTQQSTTSTTTVPPDPPPEPEGGQQIDPNG